MKIETKVVIEKQPVDLIGTIKDLKFYRHPSFGDDLVYIVQKDSVIGTIECGMGQGCGFISKIKEIK